MVASDLERNDDIQGKKLDFNFGAKIKQGENGKGDLK